MGNGSTASPNVGDGQWLHCFPKKGDGSMAPQLPQRGGWVMAPRLPQCWGWAMAPLLPQRGGWLHGSTASPKRGVGYGSTASPMLGMGNGSTAPLLPQGRDRQMPIGWDREGCAPAVCIFGRGYGKAHRMYFWEGLSPKRGLHCVHPRPSRNATGRHVGLLACDIG